MTFGLRCCSPARRLRPASLLVRVPTAKSLLPVLSAYALQPGLTFRYGWRHRPRRVFPPDSRLTCQPHECGAPAPFSSAIPSCLPEPHPAGRECSRNRIHGVPLSREGRAPASPHLCKYELPSLGTRARGNEAPRLKDGITPRLRMGLAGARPSRTWPYSSRFFGEKVWVA